MSVGTTVVVSSGKFVQNNILMNCVVTLVVILQMATKDNQKNKITTKITKDASSINVSVYIH